MRLRLPRGVRASFSARFALVLAILGALIAASSAAIPLSASSAQARRLALERAGDKAAIAVNLVRAQQQSLATFVRQAAQQMPVDAASAGPAAARLSESLQPDDVVGVRTGDGTTVAARAGVPLSDVTAIAPLLDGQHRIASGPSGVPWLVETAPAASAPGGPVFVARPLLADTVARLAADLGSGSDIAQVTLVLGDRYVTDARVGQQVTRAGTGVTGPLRDAVVADGASVVSLGGDDVAVATTPLGAGYRLVVLSAVAGVGDSGSSVAAPVVVTAGLMILLALVVVFLVVQHDLQGPLRRLDRAVAGLGEADFDVPVPTERDDEVGRLAASFVAMRTQLQAVLAGAEGRAAIARELAAVEPLSAALQAVCARLRTTTTSRSAVLVVGGPDVDAAQVACDGIDVVPDAAALLDGGGPIASAYRGDAADVVTACPVGSAAEVALGMRTVCAAPLLLGSRRLGAVAVADRDGGYGPLDAALVSATAGQVALALERDRLLNTARRHASTDGLTGLYNYRFLVDYLDQQMALIERNPAPLALLMLDLDRFKAINDAHGHRYGDTALCAFATTINGAIRRSDLAARYGGEEFVVVMANTTREEARLVAEKIRTAVGGILLPAAPDGSRPRLSVSIGGVAHPEDAGDARRLLELADNALYRAKHEGRDRVRFAGDEVTVVGRVPKP